MTAILDLPATDPEVMAARAAVVADPGTLALIGRLADWETPATLSGHDSPAFALNLLHLLARGGGGGGDHPAIDRPLLCDTHAICEALVRYRRVEEPPVREALARMELDLASTSQGIAWPCIASLGFRGPGRRSDPCPQVTVQALRTFALLPPERRPAAATDAARTLLAIWRARGESKPYLFGHGVGFKTVKWPPFWYSVLAILEALGGYPELWRGDDAQLEDRRSITELAACLVAYNLDSDGRVTPQSCYRGFEGYSFGQKKVPSPFATAWVTATLRPFGDLADEIAEVDVLSLTSSKGGTGTARPPKRVVMAQPRHSKVDEAP